MMDENLPRWVFASVTTHFDTQLSGQGSVFVEGQPRKGFEGSEFKDYFEVRMDGPYFRQLSPLMWISKIEVNILVHSTQDYEDFHRIHQSVGYVANAFTPVQVYKYGAGDDDDDSLIGCFTLIQIPTASTRGWLAISHFGRIDPDNNIVQASVEGHYEAYLTL